MVVAGSVVWLHILLGLYWCVWSAMFGMNSAQHWMKSHSAQCTTHTHTNTDLIKHAATPPNQLQRLYIYILITNLMHWLLFIH